MNPFDDLIHSELEHFENSLDSALAADVELVHEITRYMSTLRGKRLRPALAFLSAKAVGQECRDDIINAAVAVEMIHTATMVHDDVVDEASTRRGVDTVHSRFNTRVAVLAGDFLFAQASWHLANLDNVNVVKLLSRVIMDLAEGEIKQNLNRFDSAQSFSKYINKSYCKTASLIANSCKAAGVLSGINDENLTSLYDFGKNIGLAFQVVDDILDFTGNDKQLGKPAVSDLASGYLTAPVLYALEENKQLSVLINRELAEKDDLDDALNIIMNSKAIESSRKLAEDFAMLSKEAIVWLPDSEYKRALMALPEFVLSRIY